MAASLEDRLDQVEVMGAGDPDRVLVAAPICQELPKILKTSIMHDLHIVGKVRINRRQTVVAVPDRIDRYMVAHSCHEMDNVVGTNKS